MGNSHTNHPYEQIAAPIIPLITPMGKLLYLQLLYYSTSAMQYVLVVEAEKYEQPCAICIGHNYIEIFFDMLSVSIMHTNTASTLGINFT